MGPGDPSLNLVLPHPEILVDPVIVEEGAFGGIISVDYVNPHLLEGEIDGRTFRSVPKTDRFTDSMSGFDRSLDREKLRIDHASLAVPLLGELAEVGADQCDTLELLRSVGYLAIGEIAVKPHPVRILSKVFWIRNISGKDDLDAIRGREHVRKFFCQGQDSRKRLTGLQVNHQLQTVGASLPHAATILTEHLGDWLDIHRPQAAVGAHILTVMGNKDFPVMKEHISFDRHAVLGVSLPERSRPVVIVMGMVNNRPLGPSRDAQDQ